MFLVLIIRKLGSKNYYYLEESFRLLNKSKRFRKYVGVKKPNNKKLISIEEEFLDSIIEKLTNFKYDTKYISKKQLIRIILFNELYFKKYNLLSPTKRNKFDINKNILFTLATLNTEDVDIDIKDILGAINKKEKVLNLREQICKNMLFALKFIKSENKLNLDFIRKVHGIAMADFETKTPGLFRDKQVYIYLKHTKDILNSEIKFRPPGYGLIVNKLKVFIEWYITVDINPLEKAVLTHFEIYEIHPFLDGNKRVCRLLFNKVLLDYNFPLINVSYKKDQSFDTLISSVENNDPKYLIEFVYKQYFKEIQDFLKSVDK